MTDQENRTVDIGQKILEIRKSEGMSQTEFAEKFHVTRQTVSNWENGKNYPDMETIIRISDEYGITFDELVKSDKELIRSIDRSRSVATRSVMIFALVGILVIAAVLIKLMPSITSLFYYNPHKVVATAADEDGGALATQRLELDVRVYSELYLPQFKYEFAEVTPLGFGKYDFFLEESMRIEPTKVHEVYGRIERNHIQIYDPEEFRRTDPEFVRDVAVDGDLKDWLLEDLEELDEDDFYIAYITLNDDMGYEDACKWIDKYDVGFPWALIVTGEDGDPESMGMYTDYIGTDAAFDQKKYPYLLRFKEPFMEDPYSQPPDKEKYARKHFVSMLKYQKDNPQFLKMVDGTTQDINERTIREWTTDKIDYINKNGLKVYGFSVLATKDTLEDIVNSNKVCYIKTINNSN